jgi:hypothetical protein
MAVESSFIDYTRLVDVPESPFTKLGIVAMGQIAAELVHGYL